MSNNIHHIDYYRALADKWVNETITEVELKELETWYNAGMDQELQVKLPLSFAANEECLKEDMLSAISEGTGLPRHTARRPARRYRLIKWAAAAAVILMFGAGYYFIFHNKKSSVELAAGHYPSATDIKAPSVNWATITLAGGQKIFLDSAVNGQLAVQNHVNVVKTANGKISYQSMNDQQSKEIVYNTLTNPRGSKVIDMTLADGTHVWLNTASSVTYPVAFTGHDRKVSVTGEAYFEVAPDADRPFTVSKGNMEVKVLGTRFNVNSYEDEESIKVTLLEGRVAVILRQARGDKRQLLKPGEQVQVSKAGRIKLITNADTEGALAWKNGYFQFHSERLGSIMRKISRWYDVRVEYKDESLKILPFGGVVTRFTNVSEVLKMMELTHEVRFEIEGKKIVVMKPRSLQQSD